MIALAVAALSCAVWIYLLAARGGFWRAAQRDDEPVPTLRGDIAWPRVAVVIPARDEAGLIGGTLAALLKQDYRGDFNVIVVDDHSSDDTVAKSRRAAAAARASDRVTVLTAPSLPEGWTGKLWAMHLGVRYVQALPEPPAYLLLTDADIRHAADTLTTLVRRAVRDRLVLTSLMARLRCSSFAEHAFIPAFVFFFQMLYPFAWVNRPDRKTAAAAGGCMLVERRSLQTAGGLGAIRGELIDDCALARLLKRHGPIWLGLSKRVRSARAYPSIGDVRHMIIRCAYAELQHSPWWLAATAVAMTVAFLAPPVLILSGGGASQVLGALAWAQMALAMQPSLRFYGLSRWWGLALPAIAGAYLVFTIDSACRHMRGRGGEWKGRIHRQTTSHELPGHGH
ncbi:MAG TPA: glycosyltransferase [Casimicrobiaceae bacterium]|nr:glycosyltransferase [Casimicrobiaceae bacterium]